MPNELYACDYRDDLDAIGADGCFAVPDGPGLGVAYDWAAIERATTSLHEVILD